MVCRSIARNALESLYIKTAPNLDVGSRILLHSSSLSGKVTALQGLWLLLVSHCIAVAALRHKIQCVAVSGPGCSHARALTVHAVRLVLHLVQNGKLDLRCNETVQRAQSARP